ncbi:dentin sialophosphoprotein-like [Hydractinia symbiolongicarpus]|uniref:dentin sialophosphoprotein-like n=1 Tax=Hydractinia symbiolongicarpus TaxID=13093 RepID=UPI00254B1EEB|nr:dentin sialophosphoprotein-like [Hydractinia symbiolongicarpus]
MAKGIENFVLKDLSFIIRKYEHCVEEPWEAINLSHLDNANNCYIGGKDNEVDDCSDSDDSVDSDDSDNTDDSNGDSKDDDVQDDDVQEDSFFESECEDLEIQEENQESFLSFDTPNQNNKSITNLLSSLSNESHNTSNIRKRKRSALVNEVMQTSLKKHSMSESDSISHESLTESDSDEFS